MRKAKTSIDLQTAFCYNEDKKIKKGDFYEKETQRVVFRNAL